jgi:preprotein translocase subunit SecA
MLGMLAKEDIAKAVNDAAIAHLHAILGGDELLSEQVEEVRNAFAIAGIVSNEMPIENIDDAKALISHMSALVAEHPMARNQLLGVLDMLWMTNLDDLEALSESVNLRAYGQHDPLVEYRHEASRLFHDFWTNFNAMVFSNIFKLANATAVVTQNQQKISLAPNVLVQKDPKFDHVGRNDPCPCGAKNADGTAKKFKHCHGKGQ